MASVKKVIVLTDEEKEILTKAKGILQKISIDLNDEVVDDYENYEYIADIITIDFCY